MHELLPDKPPEQELIVAQIRLTGMEYIGRVWKQEIAEHTEPLQGYLPVWDYVFCQCLSKGDGTVMVPMIRWPQDTFWENPILVPRALASILIVIPGGKIWNDYASLMGGLITLHGVLPKNIPPPPGSIIQ